MRWIGFALLTCAAAGLGHVLALERERRVRELEALVYSLELLETEVVYRLSLLEEACRRIGAAVPPCAALYGCVAARLGAGETARGAWQAAVASYERRAALTEADLRPLERLAGVVGLSAATDQQRHFALCRRETETRLAEARSRLPQVARLCRTLGVCSGLAASLLLL